MASGWQKDEKLLGIGVAEKIEDRTADLFRDSGFYLDRSITINRAIDSCGTAYTVADFGGECLAVACPKCAAHDKLAIQVVRDAR
jgi:hypothetical protein